MCKEKNQETITGIVKVRIGTELKPIFLMRIDMETTYDVFDSKYFIYFHNGNIDDAIAAVRNREDIKTVIRNHTNLHFVIELYGFFNTAYVYNENAMEILFYEHPSTEPFEIVGNIVRVQDKGEFDLIQWKWN